MKMIVFGKRSDILEIVSHKPDIVTTPQQWSQWVRSRHWPKGQFMRLTSLLVCQLANRKERCAQGDAARRDAGQRPTLPTGGRFAPTQGQALL